LLSFAVPVRVARQKQPKVARDQSADISTPLFFIIGISNDREPSPFEAPPKTQSHSNGEQMSVKAQEANSGKLGV
jgi:hypothetical protein